MAVVDSTIRLDTALKARLDKLRARLEARTGARMSQQEVVRRLVALGEADVGRLDGGEPAKPGRRMTPDQLRAFLARQPRDYPPTDSSKIDEVLYGGEHP